MNKTLLRIIPATALSGLLLATAAWSMGHPHGRDFDHERMLDRMVEHLQLTEVQEAEIGALFDEASVETEADKARMDEIRDALRAQRESFDAGAAQKLADELGEITARLTYNAVSTRAQVYEVLTEEQREELAELREEHGDRKSRRWSRD